MSQGMNKVIIFGAGKIGRGFIAQLCYRSGLHIFFVDAIAEHVDALNAAGSYMVHIAGDAAASETIYFERAFLPNDPDLADVFEDCQLIVSCVGARFIESTAAQIKQGLQRRKQQQACNWIICENAHQPAQMIEQVLLQDAEPAWMNYVQQHLGLIETQVLRSGMPVDDQIAQKEPLALKMQDWWTLPADADAVRTALPPIEGLQLRHNFSNELQRKLYTFNGLNGPIAYMGAYYGHSFMHEAANDPNLQTFYDEIQEESTFALINHFAFDRDEQLAFQALARNKYADPALNDSVQRNARDSARKLSAQERLWGPALLAYKYGRMPRAYLRAIAAALFFVPVDDNDVGTFNTQQLLSGQGVEQCLLTLAGQDLPSKLIAFIVDEYNAMVEQQETYQHAT